MTNAELKEAILKRADFQFGVVKGMNMALYNCYAIFYNNDIIAVNFTNDRYPWWAICFYGNRYATRVCRVVEKVAEKENVSTGIYMDTEGQSEEFKSLLRRKLGMRIW